MKAIFYAHVTAFVGLVHLSLGTPAWAAPCSAQSLGVARVIEIGPTPPIGLKSYPRTLALADKELVLTFDDGPNPGTTAKVLDALKAECARATFFLVGRNAAAHPALVRRILAEGHTIGHHTFSHPALTLRNLSQDAAIGEIHKGIEADDRAAYGHWSGITQNFFFRYPGFGDTPALNAKLMESGMVVFGADLWSSDWEPMSADVQLEVILGRVEKTRKGIVLMHDTKQQTADSLPGFLRALKERDYKIVHVTPKPDAAPTALAQAPAGWSSETERVLRTMWPKAIPKEAVPKE